MVSLEKIFYEMQRFYVENGNDRSLEYSYGFLDALSVLRNMQQEEQMK